MEVYFANELGHDVNIADRGVEKIYDWDDYSYNTAKVRKQVPNSISNSRMNVSLRRQIELYLKV